MKPRSTVSPGVAHGLTYNPREWLRIKPGRGTGLAALHGGWGEKKEAHGEAGRYRVAPQGRHLPNRKAELPKRRGMRVILTPRGH